jgi:hypothetical protein
MSSGSAIALAGLFVGAGLAISGVVSDFGKQYIDQQTESACWLPQTTSGLNDLAKQVVTPSFKSTFPSSLSQSDQDSVASSLSISLSDFAFTGKTADGGVINCRAGMSYTYTRPDKSAFSDQEQNIITYTVHPSQGGYTSEMGATDIPMGEVSYTDDPTPPAPPPTAPSVPLQTQTPAVVPPEVADFDQGHTDRMAYENWVNGLQGAEKDGAIFWSGQRSLTNPESCADGANNTFPNDTDSQSTFQTGCQEAQDMLGPFDLKRNSDPLYKAGWNQPIAQTQ